MSAEERLVDQLKLIRIVEVLRSSGGKKSVTVLSRIHDAKEWLPVVDTLLTEEEKQEEWKIHICKNYLRSEGRLTYGWNLTLQAQGSTTIDSAVKDFCRLLDLSTRHLRTQQIKNVKPTDVPGAGMQGKVVGGEVVEMPLVGDTPNRNTPSSPRGAKGSRGAHLI